MLVASVALGNFAGFGLDRLLGSQPWLTLLGLIIGTAAGFWHLHRR
jgi:F0F1-type ATP synthase assembly protein I